MRLLIIACAALPISAATAEPPATPAPAPVRPLPQAVAASGATAFAQLDPGKQCPKAAIQPAAREGSPKVRNLGELPPAEAYHAVYRTDGEGCIDPVMVGYQFGRR